MSKSNHISALVPGEMPSLDFLARYARGELSATEHEALEKAMAEDPFLQDAVAGLAEIEDTEQLSQTVSRLRREAHSRLPQREPKREQLSKRRSRVAPKHFSNLYLAVAAGIVLLLLGVWMIQEFRQAPRETMAQAESSVMPEENSPPAAAAEAGTTEEETPTGKNAAALQDQPEPNLASRSATGRTNSATKAPATSAAEDAESAPSPPPAPVVQNTPAATAPTTATTESEAMDPASEDDKARAERPGQLAEKSEADREAQADQDDFLTEEEVASIPLAAPAPEPTNQDLELAESAPAREAGSAKKSRKQADSAYGATPPPQSQADSLYGQLSKSRMMALLLSEAVALYENQQYSASLQKLDEILQAMPQHPEASYYAGSIHFQEGRQRLAEARLELALTAGPQAPYFADAQWELAQTYLARKKRKAASRLLTEIVAAGGPHAAAADTLLRSLD